MAHVVLARPDIIAIWERITPDSPTAARQLINRINERCQLYATQRMAGTPGDRHQAGLRYFPVGSYVVLYRPDSGGILVIRVLHGSRNLEDIFRDQNIGEPFARLAKKQGPGRNRATSRAVG